MDYLNMLNIKGSLEKGAKDEAYLGSLNRAGANQ